MKFKQKILAVAIAAALPSVAVHAQSNAELLQQIQALKAQVEALTSKVEAVSNQAGAVNPQEFNRLVQKVDLAEDKSIASGFKGLKFKGAIEASYIHDPMQVSRPVPPAAALVETQRFGTGNGNGATGVFEISKDLEGGANWMLRLTPTAGTTNPFNLASLIHEATFSLPLGDNGIRLNAGLMPDFQGYESYFAHQNPLITHNALFEFATATSYEGAGLSYALGKWNAKWVFGNIDGQRSGKSPGIAYRADYTVSEFTTVGFAGAHSRTTRRFDLMEVDGGYTRGDWLFNGQLNFGRERLAAANGGDSQWWGVSALAGYKVTPTLQLLTRFDFINNRKNGGGIYAATTSDNIAGFGPELDNTGTVIDPNRGANRYRLSAGFNYSITANAAWKTEIRVDRSSGYNFQDPRTLQFKRSNVLLGTSVVVSF